MLEPGSAFCLQSLNTFHLSSTYRTISLGYSSRSWIYKSQDTQIFKLWIAELFKGNTLLLTSSSWNQEFSTFNLVSKHLSKMDATIFWHEGHIQIAEK